MTEKKRDLQEELAAANRAVQDDLRVHSVSQGLHDGEKDSAQNDESKNAAEPNKDDNLEHFEKLREERLKAALKEAKADS